MPEACKNVLLKCEELGFGYTKDCFAAPMNFELQSGEVVALLGENGCGKSTLLKTMAGVIPSQKGSVLLQQKNDELVCTKSLSSRDLAKCIALVRMSGLTPERMTVREFVSLGRSPYAGIFDGRNDEDECAVDDAIDLLELTRFADRQVSSLSDGERSRVYLAEAIAQQVRILLLDEPNAFLDIPRSHKLFRLLKVLAQERNVGIIVSTHSVEYAKKYCDRIMVIHDEKVRVENANEAGPKGLLDWTETEGE